MILRTGTLTIKARLVADESGRALSAFMDIVAVYEHDAGHEDSMESETEMTIQAVYDVCHLIYHLEDDGKPAF